MWLPRASSYDRREEGHAYHYGSKQQRHKRSCAPQRLAPLDEEQSRRGRSNQSDGEDEYYHNRDRRRYSEARYLPQPMAMMYLPPLEYYESHRRHDRHGRRRRSQTRHYKRGDSSSSSSSSSEHEERVDRHTPVNLRSQRVRSLQAMAQLQRNAARVIQQEYLFYRNRCRNRARQATQLLARANRFLDTFLNEDVLPHLVSETLLDALRDQANQSASCSSCVGDSDPTIRAEVVYHELLDSVVSDVFQAVVDSMVHEYMVSHLDLARTAQPPDMAVASDILEELVADLAAEIVPEALSELVQDYISWRHHDDHWQILLSEELCDLAVDATVELTMEAMLAGLEVGSNGYS